MPLLLFCRPQARTHRLDPFVAHRTCSPMCRASASSRSRRAETPTQTRKGRGSKKAHRRSLIVHSHTVHVFTLTQCTRTHSACARGRVLALHVTALWRHVPLNHARTRTAAAAAADAASACRRCSACLRESTAHHTANPGCCCCCCCCCCTPRAHTVHARAGASSLSTSPPSGATNLSIIVVVLESDGSMSTDRHA